MDPKDATAVSGKTNVVRGPSTSGGPTEKSSTAETVESPTKNAAMSREKQKELQKKDFM